MKECDLHGEDATCDMCFLVLMGPTATGSATKLCSLSSAMDRRHFKDRVLATLSMPLGRSSLSSLGHRRLRETAEYRCAMLGSTVEEVRRAALQGELRS